VNTSTETILRGFLVHVPKQQQNNRRKLAIVLSLAI